MAKNENLNETKTYTLKNIHYLTKAQFESIKTRLEPGSEYNITDDALVIFSNATLDPMSYTDPETGIPGYPVPMGNGGVGTICLHAPKTDPQNNTYIYICTKVEYYPEGHEKAGQIKEYVWDYIPRGSGTEGAIEPFVNFLTQRKGLYGQDPISGTKYPLYIPYNLSTSATENEVKIPYKVNALTWNEGSGTGEWDHRLDKELTIPVAEAKVKAGIITAQDKSNLDMLRKLFEGDASHTGTNAIRIPYFFNVEYEEDKAVVTASGVYLNDNNEIVWEPTENTLNINVAEEDKAGLMSATDKKKADQVRKLLEKSEKYGNNPLNVTYRTGIVIDSDKATITNYTAALNENNKDIDYREYPETITGAQANTTVGGNDGKAGLMVAEDKRKLNVINELLTSKYGPENLNIPYYFDVTAQKDSVTVKDYTTKIDDNGQVVRGAYSLPVPVASYDSTAETDPTKTHAGIITATDKKNLDNASKIVIDID